MVREPWESTTSTAQNEQGLPKLRGKSPERPPWYSCRAGESWGDEDTEKRPSSTLGPPLCHCLLKQSDCVLHGRFYSNNQSRLDSQLSHWWPDRGVPGRMYCSPQPVRPMTITKSTKTGRRHQTKWGAILPKSLTKSGALQDQASGRGWERERERERESGGGKDTGEKGREQVSANIQQMVNRVQPLR